MQKHMNTVVILRTIQLLHRTFYKYHRNHFIMSDKTTKTLCVVVSIDFTRQTVVNTI